MAIVVASLDSVEQWCQSFSVRYPMLADQDHSVSDAYGVFNVFGRNLAGPAVFVVDRDGSIVWSRLGQATAEEILAQVP